MELGWGPGWMELWKDLHLSHRCGMWGQGSCGLAGCHNWWLYSRGETSLYHIILMKWFASFSHVIILVLVFVFVLYLYLLLRSTNTDWGELMNAAYKPPPVTGPASYGWSEQSTVYSYHFFFVFLHICASMFVFVLSMLYFHQISVCIRNHKFASYLYCFAFDFSKPCRSAELPTEVGQWTEPCSKSFVSYLCCRMYNAHITVCDLNTEHKNWTVL